MPSKIKVAHLSDMPFGGAAVAAQRLVQGLTETDAIEVEHWVFGNDENSRLSANQAALEKDFPKTALERVVRVFARSGAKALQRQRQRKALLSALSTRRPDILHLHNLHATALRHEDLALIPRHVHLVWTMHDCWPFAPWAYRWKGENGTDEIQGAKEIPPSEALAARRIFFVRRENAVMVSPSSWLGLQARRFDHSNLRVEVIPNGVPTDVFVPTPKPQAKADLGLDPAKIWIGLSAASFDHRKGADILLDALAILPRNDLGIVLWGGGDNMQIPDSVGMFSAGYVRDECRQALLYSACDLFVCPSRIDNFPNTVLESMACGTPVIASDVGGIPEMVGTGETGWLYAPTTAGACASAVQEACQSRDKWSAYGKRCRELAETKFSLRRQAANYLGLYLELADPDQTSSKSRP
jgi:glycosyltransferase involved in cell wall biosynthesis